jgi:hypothetical protein
MSHVTLDRNRSTGRRLLWWASLAVLAGFGLPQDSRAAPDQGQAPAASPKEKIVALKETPVWEVANERVRASFLRGQYAPVREKRKGMVVPGKWPEFTSDAPLYGEVNFQHAVSNSGKSDRITFALDSSRKGGDYDLFYFDENGDGDVTNDKVRKPAKESQRLVSRSPSIKETWFEPLAMTFDFGPGGRQT